MKISTFRGVNRYLSNFWPAPFEYMGVRWTSSENAYQAMKSADPTVWENMKDMSPYDSKAAGQRIYKRPDWEAVQYEVMYAVVNCKFRQNSDLMGKLVSTGNILIEEGNTWGDVRWGISPPDSGQGENWLGKILMKIREENS